MRKKSHISLAKDIVHRSDDDLLKKHKWAFYLGSILPDIQPSFLYKKHEFSGTFDQVCERIGLLSALQGEDRKQKTKYYRDLGQITHYIADYFTFPHNKVYPGNLKEHCSYEGELKQRLLKYLETKEGREEHLKQMEFISSKELCDFVKKNHEEYLKRKIGIEEDIRHIVSLNHQVVEGIKQLVEKGGEHWLKK
ncbi:MAG: zinc dependent phospholipase C family protein [Lachnospiraceae bacterium]|jgi:hypothetical protein|nr:zinc dependent phospholipase C family protein [Lachnospiraceae bacterium]